VNKILLLAAAYFVTGKLGLMLAVPPGYATAIWPPSGIALAGIIIFGWRAWLGVLIGSFLVNISVGASPSLANIFSLGVPLMIATGAALQAVIGAILVRKFAGFPNDLANVKEVFTFLFWGALVSCLVNSTISVTTLMLSGKITATNFLFNWWTWWLGDVIGVLIFTPLILVWTLKPDNKWRTRRLPVTLTMSTTFFLTLISVNLGTSWEIKQLEFQFNQHATNLARTFEKNLFSHFEVMHSLKSFYRASSHIAREEFKIFMERSFTDLSGIQALSWNPLVYDSERESFERATRQEGLTDFQITERNSAGELIRAAQRPTYVTVHYIEPFATNQKALGFDVSSNPVRREALELARDTGKFVSTARITLVQETGQQFGLLVFMPIYKKDLPYNTLEERRKNLAGYMVGVFRAGDLVRESLHDLDQKGLFYQLLDESASIEEQTLFNSHDSGTANISIPLEHYLFAWSTKRLEANFPFIVGQRHWNFQIMPTQEYVAKYRPENAWLILVMGLLISSLVGAFVMVISGRDVLLQHLVEKRTREYEEKNQLLEQEIIIRKQAEKEADSANRMKSEFLANMSHEIRTPMNAVIGFSDLLIPLVKDKQQKNYLDSIITSGRALLSLINDILDLSKIEAGHLEIQYSHTDLNLIFLEIQQIFMMKANEKGLDFIIKIEKGLPTGLIIDEIRIRQIVINLVSNAIKFTKQGYIKISVHKVFCENHNKINLIIAVEDTGIGIPEEQQARMFESFTQVEGQSTRQYGGTGLGLAISKRLIKLMNGEIMVQSKVNSGSVFTIILKDVELSAIGTRESQQQTINLENISFEKATVLVVDDIESNRILIRECLNQVNLKVIEAQNGEIGLLCAEENQPDLILMDLKMPIMDGYQATEKLKENVVTKNIPVIALTASATSEEKQKMETSAFDGYLYKPVDVSELLGKLSQYLKHTKREIEKAFEVKSKESTEQVDIPFSAEELEKLSELVKILENEMLADSQELAYLMDMDGIERFAEKIIILGENYRVKLLTEYGNKLAGHTENFELDNMTKTIKGFDKIIRRINAMIER